MDGSRLEAQTVAKEIEPTLVRSSTHRIPVTIWPRPTRTCKYRPTRTCKYRLVLSFSINWYQSLSSNADPRAQVVGYGRNCKCRGWTTGLPPIADFFQWTSSLSGLTVVKYVTRRYIRYESTIRYLIYNSATASVEVYINLIILNHHLWTLNFVVPTLIACSLKPSSIACYRARIYNRHGVFDTNRLRHIIYTPLLAN